MFKNISRFLLKTVKFYIYYIKTNRRFSSLNIKGSNIFSENMINKSGQMKTKGTKYSYYWSPEYGV